VLRNCTEFLSALLLAPIMLLFFKPLISREDEKEGGIATVADGTYTWSSSVTHIFRSDLPSNRGDRKTFDVINVTCSLEILGSITSSLVAFFLSSKS
jgi:hypothetical protein